MFLSKFKQLAFLFKKQLIFFLQGGFERLLYNCKPLLNSLDVIIIYLFYLAILIHLSEILYSLPDYLER
jgi:hypothetical protein